MITFGLTGNIAMGKSTVTKTFLSHNIPMVDADLVARQVVKPGTYGLALIKKHFGLEYLQEDGTLDRTKLGALVFADPVARRSLDNIMLPLITTEANFQLQKLHSEGHYIVGYDAALICEMGQADNFRPLIVVQCLPEIQLERLMNRNNLTQAEAMNRIESQMPVDKKVAMADYVIDTSTTKDVSISQTEIIAYNLKVKMWQEKLDKDEVDVSQVPLPWRNNVQLST